MNTLINLLENVSVREQWRRIMVGLHAPQDSGERRYAMRALLQMFGPSSISILGSLLVASAALFIHVGDNVNRVYIPDFGQVIEIIPNIAQPPKLELEEKIPDKNIEDIKPDNPVTDSPWNQGSAMVDKPFEATDLFSKTIGPLGSQDGITDKTLKQESDLSPILAKGPAIIRGLLGRTEEERRIALGLHGAPAGGGGTAGGLTEGAVLKALRWLKKEQQPDGSWKNTKPAMTGLAILAYLAHGETPASQEFGQTVENGIRWLLDSQEADGHFKGRDAHDYSHPIATYAMCEAYGMMRLPVLKVAAEKAMDIIIKGQHPGGGWDYNCKQSDRDDLSYMGWCVQALKAANIAGLENEGLKETMKKAVNGLKRNADSGGKFGYTSPKDGNGGLTGVGVLCLQMLGAGREPETMKGLMWLQQATYDWEKPWLTSPIYYWYYVTQAKFQGSGEIWNAWNAKFAVQLVRNQKQETNAIKGPDGKMHDVGWWEPPAEVKGHSDGPVMDTALCTLQLEVYYRYLPTYKIVVPDGMEKKEVNSDLQITFSKAPIEPF